MARTPIASDFWLPVYQANDGSLYSDGQTGNTFLVDDQWAVVYLATAPTPGIAHVTTDKDRDVDLKKGVGVDGERATLHGDKLAHVDIGIEIWTPEQWEALKALWPILKVPAYKLVTSTTQKFINPLSPSSAGEPTTVGATTVTNTTTGATQTIPVVATKNVKSSKKVAITFDVSHPALALHGIKAVQIVGGRGPVPGRYPQSRIFTIKCIEYLPPGKASSTKTDNAPITAPSTLQSTTWPTPGSNPANMGP